MMSPPAAPVAYSLVRLLIYTTPVSGGNTAGDFIWGILLAYGPFLRYSFMAKGPMMAAGRMGPLEGLQ
jgi:hypothetical protein